MQNHKFLAKVSYLHKIAMYTWAKAREVDIEVQTKVVPLSP